MLVHQQAAGGEAMNWLKELARRIFMLLHRRQFRADLDEEMQLHLELREQQQAERGLPIDEARSIARRRFGNATRIKERSQMAWGWAWLESLMQDALYGVRAMLRSPVLTAVALLSLALGIGANTAIFTFMDAVMLRSLPVKDPRQLVLLGHGTGNGITDALAETELYSYPFYRQFQQKNQVFQDVAAIFSMYNDVHGYVAERGEQEPMNIQLVSGTYFPTLGVRAMLGRTLTDADDNTEDNHPVAMVSYAWWTRSLARDPAVLDRTLRIGSTVFSIVGVAPPEFFGTKVGESPDIWIPLSMAKAVPPHWGGYSENFYEPLYIIGRVKPGVSAEQVSANVNLVYRQIEQQFMAGVPDSPRAQRARSVLPHTNVPLTPMATGISDIRAEFSAPLRILMTVVVLVLLIACANIANLLLARSTARARELALRQALGAGRLRIVRQLLTESLTLALAGGALGVAFAAGANRLLLRMVSGADMLPLDVSLNLKLLVFTLGVTLFTAVLFGTIPALRATRLELTESLKDGRGATGSAAKGPLAKALVVTQVAFSLVLLVGAGLFLRSLINLNHVETGFNKDNVLLLQIDDSSAGYKKDDPRLIPMHEEIERRVGALPGVQAASYASFTFTEGSWNGPVYVQGVEKNSDVNVPHNVIGAGYFSAMRIPIVAGRGFGPQDTVNSPKVAIVSETMARTMFPAGSPIGRRYGTGGAQHAGDLEVIGVAKDVKFQGLSAPDVPMDYFPYSQGSDYMNELVVLYSGDLGSISSAAQKAIHSIDRNLPITHVSTLDDSVALSVIDERLLAQLSTFFGLLAVFLSSIGIYGLMSYVVSRRTSEIGIRMALGAERSDVRWMVMREIVVLVAVGIAIGIPVTLAGGRLVTSMLFELHAADPWSLLAAVVILLAVALLAGYLPARRASRIDPTVALRYE
jgi:predicted permease